MPEPLDERLSRLAARLDEVAPPLTPDEVTGRSEPAHLRPRRRAPYAWGAGLAAAAVVAVALLTAGGNDGPQQVDSANPAPTTASSAPLPAEDVLALREADADKPTLLVYNDDEMALVDYTGTEYARAKLNGWTTNTPDDGVDLSEADGGLKPVTAVAIDDPVDGCHAVHGGGGVRVAACGGLGDPGPAQLRLIDSAGDERVLTGPVAEVGHWRYGLPSPTGQWVLAQWSAECEVPVAYLVAVGTGQVTAIAAGEVSRAVTWVGEQAVVGIGTGPGCGNDQTEKGTYLLAPGNPAERTKVHDFFQAAVIVNRHPEPENRTNRLERRLERARGELGLEGCCGEPSHGAEHTADGIVFEDQQIEILAYPEADAAALEKPGAGEVRFRCGEAVYQLAQFDRSRSDGALIQRAVDRLVPRLYCTPPEGTLTGDRATVRLQGEVVRGAEVGQLLATTTASSSARS